MNRELLSSSLGWTLAVDPGVRYAAVALFRDGRLTRCALVPGGDRPAGELDREPASARHAAKVGRAVAAWLGETPYGLALWVELAQAYERRTATHANVTRLRRTATEVYRAVAAGRADVTRHEVAPFAWKGQVPKHVHHARIERVLAPAERRLARGLDHNVWDAIALGLFAVGRVGRGGTTADPLR